MSTVSTEKMMAQIACKAIDDKKGQDIKVIDIHTVSDNCRLLCNRKRYQLQPGSGDRRQC